LGTGQKFFNDFSELVWIPIYAKSLKSLANLAETVQTDPGSRPPPAAVGASVLGEDFSKPRFHPVWAKAEELGAVLFIHPQSTPDLARRFKGNGWLANTIGNPLDTTIALQHLIFEGTLDRFPGLRSLPRMAADISAPTRRAPTTPITRSAFTARPDHSGSYPECLK
jgi:hypothetical protein